LSEPIRLPHRHPVIGPLKPLVYAVTMAGFMLALVFGLLRAPALLAALGIENLDPQTQYAFTKMALAVCVPVFFLVLFFSGGIIAGIYWTVSIFLAGCLLLALAIGFREPTIKLLTKLPWETVEFKQKPLSETVVEKTPDDKPTRTENETPSEPTAAPALSSGGPSWWLFWQIPFLVSAWVLRKHSWASSGLITAVGQLKRAAVRLLPFLSVYFCIFSPLTWESSLSWKIFAIVLVLLVILTAILGKRYDWWSWLTKKNQSPNP